MKDEEIVKLIAQRAEIGRSDARSAAEATLGVLAERLEAGEAADLADQLPEELGRALRNASRGPDAFGKDEFVSKVAERESIAPNDADKRIRAVLSVLQDAVTAGVLEHVLSQLPADYLELMGGTPRG